MLRSPLWWRRWSHHELWQSLLTPRQNHFSRQLQPKNVGKSVKMAIFNDLNHDLKPSWSHNCTCKIMQTQCKQCKPVNPSWPVQCWREQQLNETALRVSPTDLCWFILVLITVIYSIHLNTTEYLFGKKTTCTLRHPAFASSKSHPSVLIQEIPDGKVEVRWREKYGRVEWAHCISHSMYTKYHALLLVMFATENSDSCLWFLRLRTLTLPLSNIGRRLSWSSDWQFFCVSKCPGAAGTRSNDPRSK